MLSFTIRNIKILYRSFLKYFFFLFNSFFIFFLYLMLFLRLYLLQFIIIIIFHLQFVSRSRLDSPFNKNLLTRTGLTTILFYSNNLRFISILCFGMSFIGTLVMCSLDLTNVVTLWLGVYHCWRIGLFYRILRHVRVISHFFVHILHGGRLLIKFILCIIFNLYNFLIFAIIL